MKLLVTATILVAIFSICSAAATAGKTDRLEGRGIDGNKPIYSSSEQEKLIKKLSDINKSMKRFTLKAANKVDVAAMPIEYRYFKEGSTTFLETPLPESIGSAVQGVKFMKSSPHKQRNTDKIAADLMAVWTKSTISVIDMSGAPISEYQAINHTIDFIAEAFEGGQKASNAFFTLDATQMIVTEIAIVGKKVDSKPGINDSQQQDAV